MTAREGEVFGGELDGLCFTACARRMVFPRVGRGAVHVECDPYTWSAREHVWHRGFRIIYRPAAWRTAIAGEKQEEP